MNREEALEHFYQQVVKEESFNALVKTYEQLKARRDEYTKIFLDHYIILYEKIVTLQKEREKNIGFIHTHILRTGVYFGDYTINLSAYDQQWYLDKEPIVVEFELKEFFTYLQQLEQIYKNKVKPYVRKLTAADAIVAKQKELKYYLHFLTHITHRAIAQSTKTEVYKQIKTGDSLNFYTGEYRDNFSLSYKVDTLQQDQQQLRAFFENTDNTQRSKQKLMFSDFNTMNFEAIDMRFYNLSYANFENAIIAGSDLSGCALAAAHFEYANMSHVTMQGCLIQDACFDYANLTLANLTACVGNLQQLTLEQPFIFGLYGVSFRGANLTDTDFTDSNLSGANFIDAIFNNTNFTNTLLTNAVFNRAAAALLNLTQQQRNSIKLID